MAIPHTAPINSRSVIDRAARCTGPSPAVLRTGRDHRLRGQRFYRRDRAKATRPGTRGFVEFPHRCGKLARRTLDYCVVANRRRLDWGGLEIARRSRHFIEASVRYRDWQGLAGPAV